MAIFTNQASLTYRNITRNSNIATGQILEALSATKSAVTGDYTAGDTVTYVISVVNAGNTPSTAVSITDNLGAYTVGTSTVYPLTYVDGSVKYYVNGVLQASPAVVAGPPLTVTGITIPAGGNITVIYEAAVNEFAPLVQGASINNTATVNAAGQTTPITVSETVVVRSLSDLTISKSITPETVTENGEITYTFVIQNTGNAEAGTADNAVINDTFNPVLENITVTYNGTILTEGVNYTYNESTGVFATLPGQITVPAATYSQDPATGAITTTPGVSVLTVTGTV
jgi:uncharacterized repeat protein (TIGR01451 family)